MKTEVVASHRTLFYILIGLFEALLVISIFILWSLDPRRMNPLEDSAEVTAGFSLLGLFVLWWLLRRGEPRLARVCFLSAFAGILCSMLLPAVP